LPDPNKYPDWKSKQIAKGIYAGKVKKSKKGGTHHKKGGFMAELAGSALGTLLPMAIDGIKSLFHKKGNGRGKTGHGVKKVKVSGYKQSRAKPRFKKGGAMIQPGPLA
jgi:hypothetical protein